MGFQNFVFLTSQTLKVSESKTPPVFSSSPPPQCLAWGYERQQAQCVVDE